MQQSYIYVWKSSNFYSLIRDMRLLTFACLFVLHWLSCVTIKAFATIVTVSPCGLVFAIHANTTRDATRYLVEFHVETAFACMSIAVTSYKKKKEKGLSEKWFFRWGGSIMFTFGPKKSKLILKNHKFSSSLGEERQIYRHKRHKHTRCTRKGANPLRIV